MSKLNIFDSPICLADIGAAGGIHKRWKKFTNIHVLGFEPDARTYKNLPQDDRYTWFNTALYNINGTFPIYITKASTNTSMLMPNYDLLKQLAYGEDDFDVVTTENIECDTLDNVSSQSQFNPDVVKIDTQGSELYILQGSTATINKSTFAIEVEVEFLPLYKDQPLFTQVHDFMLDNNFQLMDYGNALHVKGKNTIGIGGAKSNLISCDALYFKDIKTTVNGIKNNSISLPAVVAICCSYGYEDYAIEICTQIIGTSTPLSVVAEKYISYLSSTKSLTQKIINKLNLSDGSIRRISRFTRKLIPVKHASWLPGLGNKQ